MRLLKQYVFLSIMCLLAVCVAPTITALSAAGSEQAVETSATAEQTVSVYFCDSGEVKSFSLEEYLVGVLCAEVPSSFHIEALKAQAVAARSYALYKIQHATEYMRELHEGADLCTNSGHCKAYFSPSDYKGDLEKMKEAVMATKGQIATYEGKVINAVFHASSSGYTQDAAMVWGGSVAPYLRGVESPGDEDFVSTVTLDKDVIAKALSEYVTEYSETPATWFTNPTYTIGKNVATIDVCGVTITGTDIRQALSLKSTAFEITSYENGIFTFKVTGYGHGVGMSQQGANTLANKGKNYREILQHYYTGIEIK